MGSKHVYYVNYAFAHSYIKTLSYQCWSGQASGSQNHLLQNKRVFIFSGVGIWHNHPTFHLFQDVGLLHLHPCTNHSQMFKE